GATLAIGPSAGNLDPLTRHLVADAPSVFRRIAGLSVHLDGALALIFERHEQIVFLTAPQHARVPGPVEHHCLQVLCTGCRGVLLRTASAPATAALRAAATTTLGRRSRRCS